MRTTIIIQNDLLKLAKDRTKAHSPSGAVNAALADWARRLRVDKIKQMAGKVHFDGNYRELRNLEK